MREELDAAAASNAGATDAYNDVPKPGLVAPVAAHEAARRRARRRRRRRRSGRHDHDHDGTGRPTTGVTSA